MRYCTSCGQRFEEHLLFCPNDGARTEAVPTSMAPGAPGGEPVDKLIGRTVDGRYRIDQKIGEGGMGNVYLATHVVLNRRIALKVLAGDMAKNPEVVQRFKQEAQAATSIGHDNIIDISDFGTLPDGATYFVMEFLDGRSLTQLLEQSPTIPNEDIVIIMRQIVAALVAAHSHGIVHRDLKPDNIFLIKRQGSDKFIKVLDFGIAKVGGAASKLTQTGVIFGTPHYMSPEQAAGQAIDHRSDIYSLGVILYELCVGKVPFDADTYMGILSKHMFETPAVDPTVAEGRDLGPWKGMVVKALQKKPADRYQSMEEMLADVEKIAKGGAIRVSNTMGAVAARDSFGDIPGMPSGKKKVPWIPIVVGLGVVLGVGGWFATHSGDKPADTGAAAAVAQSDKPAAPVPSPMPAAIAPTTPPPPEPAVRKIKLKSTPEHAEVLEDGTTLGNTDLEVPCPAPGTTKTYVVRLAGYEDQALRLSDTCKDEWRVELKAIPKPEDNEGNRTKSSKKRPKKGGGGSSDVVDPWG